MLAGWEAVYAADHTATEAAQSAGTTAGPVRSPAQGTDEATSGSGTSEEERRKARTELNLLGEVDTEAGESRRNENVQLTLVDNNVLKEINVRMGTSATIVRDFEVSSDYFGAEFGMPPQRQIHLAPSDVQGWHAEVYETHGNSLFSARSFFQVGSVRPARSNSFGVRALAPLPGGLGLSARAGRQRNRGNVNGNILMPRPDEREPLATDPATRAFVARILDLAEASGEGV